MKTNFTEPEEIILEESPDIPPHYLKVKAIIGIYIAVIYEMLESLNIKRDGAIDEITDKLYKRFDSVLDFYINIKAQRVEDIIVSKIVENLELSGGFSHETAGSLSVFISEKYGIKIVTDGMHRLIKAFLCGVDELAWTLE